ncbi:MAG: GNAT family N-acetyltransferase [Pseudomonadota bacterium]
MADGSDQLTIEMVEGMSAINQDDWSTLLAATSSVYHPFLDYRFLSALEASSSVGSGTGWQPCHLIARRGGALVGAAPLYLKQHSYGEFVFDHHWADAYERAGGRYYPKLLCAAAFTPATGPRLLVASKIDKELLAQALQEVATKLSVSSVHVNFTTEEDRDRAKDANFHIREGIQYHWENDGYTSFDDFLAALASRKRKAIRRERRNANESGLTIRQVTGSDISEADWDAFWHFYQDTGQRKWGSPYLTRSFFRMIGETMSDKILLNMADRDGVPIAGALNMIGGDTLYGRYWGCTEYHAFLHFELCYYQAIDYAIVHGLSRVEAGAQGEHKLARGYAPVKTYSAHWFQDPGFHAAIEKYLDAERDHTDAEVTALADFVPFKKTDPSQS